MACLGTRLVGGLHLGCVLGPHRPQPGHEMQSCDSKSPKKQLTRLNPLLLFETGSPCVAQTGLELST